MKNWKWFSFNYFEDFSFPSLGGNFDEEGNYQFLVGSLSLSLNQTGINQNLVIIITTFQYINKGLISFLQIQDTYISIDHLKSCIRIRNIIFDHVHNVQRKGTLTPTTLNYICKLDFHKYTSLQ